MTRLNSLYITLLGIGLLFLTACQSGGGSGYNFQPWEFGRGNKPAVEAPQQTTQPQTPQAAISEQQSMQTMPAPEAPKQKPVKVALLLPLTGPNAELGKAMLQAAQMALFDIGNNAFELLPRDTKDSTEAVKTAAKSAIDEGAQLILGPVFSKDVRAAKEAISFSNVNMIAFSTDWSLAGGNTYIMGFLPFDQVERITRFAASKNMSPVAVLAPSSDYGRAVVSSYQSIAPKIGLQSAEVKTYAANGANLATIVPEFAKPGQFNAVLMPSGGTEASRVAGLLSEAGLPPTQVTRLGTGLFDDENLADDGNMNGALFAAPSPQLRQDFENRFRSTYGKTAPRLATLSYDATALASVLAVRGLEKNGQPAFDKASIGNPNGFFGLDGIFRFRSNGTAERGLAVLQFNNGRIEIVEDAPKTFQQSAY